MSKSQRGPYIVTFRIPSQYTGTTGKQGDKAHRKQCIICLSRPGDAKKKLHHKNAIIEKVVKAW
jgi:hypothetical protein